MTEFIVNPRDIAALKRKDELFSELEEKAGLRLAVQDHPRAANQSRLREGALRQAQFLCDELHAAGDPRAVGRGDAALPDQSPEGELPSGAVRGSHPRATRVQGTRAAGSGPDEGTTDRHQRHRPMDGGHLCDVLPAGQGPLPLRRYRGDERREGIASRSYDREHRTSFGSMETVPVARRVLFLALLFVQERGFGL